MINNLTGLRFFLAIWVVLFHLGPSFDIPIVNEICDKGYWGVDVFFVLSGFIIALNYHQRMAENGRPRREMKSVSRSRRTPRLRLKVFM